MNTTSTHKALSRVPRALTMSFNRFIDTSSLQSLILKVPKPSSPPPQPSTFPDPTNAPANEDHPETTLTQSEIDMISYSPFVQGLPPHKSDEPVIYPTKIQNISKFIPLSEEGLLAYNRPSSAPTPFQLYTKPIDEVDEEDQPGAAGHSGTSVSEFPRLSVTRILTQSWCELRAFYDIYSLISTVETAAMVRGRELHSKLELETHPLIDTSAVEEAIPSVDKTNVDIYAESLVDTLTRLMTLFSGGDAREIYVHGFIDEFGIVEDPKSVKSDTTIVTGVIDHLFLIPGHPSEYLQLQMGKYTDIRNFIENGEKYVDSLQNQTGIVVSDVKTRSRRQIPLQESVLKSSKNQVMIYKKFLDVLGENNNGVKWLEEYCNRKKIDIDQPITPEVLLALIHTYPIFYNDFKNMVEGFPLNDPLFDNNSINHRVYDLTYLRTRIKDPEMLKFLYPFLTDWQTVPTTRYFITRLSHIFRLVSKLCHGDLRVEYRCGNHSFHCMDFQYDENEASVTVMKGLEFWMGERDPQPVDGSFKSLNSTCKHCEFQPFCAWNKEKSEELHHQAEW